MARAEVGVKVCVRRIREHSSDDVQGQAATTAGGNQIGCANRGWCGRVAHAIIRDVDTGYDTTGSNGPYRDNGKMASRAAQNVNGVTGMVSSAAVDYGYGAQVSRSGHDAVRRRRITD